jgi:DNA polymerase-1
VPSDDDSFLLLIDFDQIELRLAAHFGNEQHMIADIINGRDLHTGTCKRMFNKDETAEDFKRYRYLAKRLNFGTLYGTGPAKFSSTVLEDSNGDFRISIAEAGAFIGKWWAAHPGISELRNRVFSEVARTGGVRTHFGRFIPVESWKDHAALNYLIQGTAADVIKRAIIRVERLLKKERARTKLLLPVHDELIFNMPREEKGLVRDIVKAMQELDQFCVPLTCSVEAGLRWGKKKPVVVKL